MYNKAAHDIYCICVDNHFVPLCYCLAQTVVIVCYEGNYTEANSQRNTLNNV